MKDVYAGLFREGPLDGEKRRLLDLPLYYYVPVLQPPTVEFLSEVSLVDNRRPPIEYRLIWVEDVIIPDGRAYVGFYEVSHRGETTLWEQHIQRMRKAGKASLLADQLREEAMACLKEVLIK